MNTRLFVALRQALAQINRNKVMSVASLFSITAILLVLGVFFIIVVNINNMAEGVKQDFDSIQVNLLDEVDEEQTMKMTVAIDALEGVETVSYQTREEAMQKWKVKWGDNAYLLDRMPVNPLPNSLIVQVSSLSFATPVVNQVKLMDGVETINYSQDAVDKLVKVTEVIQIASLVIILFLIFISIFVVSNTIKLTVLAREKEITIMRYVGATNWFIRGPFLFEGMIIGIVSALVSAGLVALLYHYLVVKVGVSFLLIMAEGFVAQEFLIKNLLIIFLALGISIGACGSIVSMRRFLER